MLRVTSRLTDAEESVVSKCLDAAIAVHRELGPGFRELIYHRALLLEVDARGVAFESEKPIGVRFKEWTIPGQKAERVWDVAAGSGLGVKVRFRPAAAHTLTRAEREARAAV